MSLPWSRRWTCPWSFARGAAATARLRQRALNAPAVSGMPTEPPAAPLSGRGEDSTLAPSPRVDDPGEASDAEAEELNGDPTPPGPGDENEVAAKGAPPQDDEVHGVGDALACVSDNPPVSAARHEPPSPLPPHPKRGKPNHQGVKRRRSKARPAEGEGRFVRPTAAGLRALLWLQGESYSFWGGGRLW